MTIGVKVRHISRESPFYKAGLRPGDVVTAINGEEVSDELDFRFFAADYLLELSVLSCNLKTVSNANQHGAQATADRW